jgi:hypothetical protein
MTELYPKYQPLFKVGERVYKVGGSYQALGTVKAVFAAYNGDVRYVFEFDTPKGMLHIFNESQLEAE